MKEENERLLAVIMALITGTIVGIVITMLIIALSGCTQVIIEMPDKSVKINTLLNSVDFDSLVYEPNSLQTGRYQSIPSDVEIVFDPLTNTYKLIGKGTK